MSAVFGFVVALLMTFLGLFTASPNPRAPTARPTQAMLTTKPVAHHQVQFPSPEMPTKQIAVASEPLPVELRDVGDQLLARTAKMNVNPDPKFQNPREQEDVPEMLEFSRKEKELTQYLNQTDLRGPLSENDMQKLWELQDLYGFNLTSKQMGQVLASRPSNIDEFVERAGEIEDQFGY
jgi:hypothetical protein